MKKLMKPGDEQSGQQEKHNRSQFLDTARREAPLFNFFTHAKIPFTTSP